MIYLRLMFVSCIIFFVGCSVNNGGSSKKVFYALKGTDTVVVSVSLDDSGVPKDNVEKLVLHPGQKVIYAGPEKFDVFFKNRKSPSKTINYKSENGVVIIEIPSNILDSPEFSGEYRKNKFIRFDYGIRVNGKELDPPMIVTRRD